MKILIKKAQITDKNCRFYNETKDILIEHGIVKAIENEIIADADETIETDNLCISPSWVDVFADFADQGFEQRESLQTGAKAALAGGYGHVFLIPNTKPVIQNKPQVSYLVEQGKQLPVNIYPIGAISKNIEGKDLAEMYEMKMTGSIAFSDGTQPLQSAGLLLKALQYVIAIDGTIIQIPIDKSIVAFGLMTEGVVSTQMGLPGSPALAEVLQLKRDLDLLRYTNSKIHFTGISTAESVALIAAAKAEGLNVTCSVTPYHLFFCDEDLQGYNTNLKVNPPLRNRSDMMALRTAVEAGIIDCIATHHIPHNWDNKTCEFEYAAAGMIGLQTSFAIFNTVFHQLPNERITDLLSNNARTIFNLPNEPLAIGTAADFTLFTRQQHTILSKATNKSKSANSALLDVELNGKVIGVLTKGVWNKAD